MGSTYVERVVENKDRFNYAQNTGRKILHEKRLAAVVTELANVYAPTGTVSFMLGPVIEGLVAQMNDKGTVPGKRRRPVAVERNFLGTNNVAVIVNPEGLQEGITPHVVISHGDEISYYVTGADQNRAKLIPLCAHRQDPKKIKQKEIRSFGRVLRYFEESNGNPGLMTVAEGEIVTTATADGNEITFEATNKLFKMREGDRVVFNPVPRLYRNRDNLSGVLDNRGQVATNMLVAEALNELVTLDPGQYGDNTTIFLVSDHEEGSPNWGQGTEQVARMMERDRRYDETRFIVTDGHDVSMNAELPQVALVAPIVSEGRGPVMSMEKLWQMRLLMQHFTAMGGFAFEDSIVGTTTSRSDDEGLKNAGVSNDRITVVGAGMKGSHHDYGRPTEQSLIGLQETGQFILMLAIAASKGLL